MLLLKTNEKDSFRDLTWPFAYLFMRYLYIQVMESYIYYIGVHVQASNWLQICNVQRCMAHGLCGALRSSVAVIGSLHTSDGRFSKRKRFDLVQPLAVFLTWTVAEFISLLRNQYFGNDYINSVYRIVGLYDHVCLVIMLSTGKMRQKLEKKTKTQ